MAINTRRKITTMVNTTFFSPGFPNSGYLIPLNCSHSPSECSILLYLLTMIITSCSQLRFAHRNQIFSFYCYGLKLLSSNWVLLLDYEPLFVCSLKSNEDITYPKKLLDSNSETAAMQGKTIFTLTVTNYCPL